MREHEWHTPYRAVVGVLLAMGGAGFALYNLFHPVIRFAWPVANQLSFVLACLLPWLAAWVAITRFRGMFRVVGTAACAVYGLVLLPFAFFGVVTGTGREPLDRVSTGGNSIAIYRTDCGATCAYRIAVRRERTIVPGLLRVNELPGFYPAYTAQHELLGDSAVRITVPPYGADSLGPMRSQVYSLH